MRFQLNVEIERESVILQKRTRNDADKQESEINESQYLCDDDIKRVLLLVQNRTKTKDIKIYVLRNRVSLFFHCTHVSMIRFNVINK